MSNEIQEIVDKVNNFREERDWRKFHNEKDLAISISLEAAELLELYQWKSSEEGNQRPQEIEDELADIMIYAIYMADNLGLSISKIIEEKLKKNAAKYPVELSRGSNKKYDELQG